jgi:hypothetical protein
LIPIIAPAVAIRDAFNAARRQLQDQIRRREPQTRQRTGRRALGRVAKASPDQGSGFVEADVEGMALTDEDFD